MIILLHYFVQKRVADAAVADVAAVAAAVVAAAAVAVAVGCLFFEELQPYQLDSKKRAWIPAADAAEGCHASL